VVLLVWCERRTAWPLVPAGLWRASFVAGLIWSFGMTATTSSFVVVGTLDLQEAKGFGPGAAGLMILPFSVAVVGATTRTRQLARSQAGADDCDCRGQHSVRREQ